MHSAHDFLVNLALVLCVAAFATVLFQRLRQPLVLGYILAGLIVGPHVPVPIVADREVVEALAELGVILLMFSLGLEFRFAKLLKIAPNGGLIAVVEVSLMASLGYLVGRAFGWTTLESLFTGAVVSISSTSIIAKAFDEQGVKGRRRELVFGILIAEDLLAILLMVALSILASGQELSAAQLGTAALRLGVSLTAIVGVGLLVVPRLFRYIVALGRDETTTVAAVGLCFAVALASQSLGYSSALGAFLGGMLVAESGHGEHVEHVVRPVRDVFAALFFVAVGMLIDPMLVLENIGPVLALCVVVVVGKVVAVSLGAFLLGNGTRTSIQAGMSLAQIGEFSFILAGLGATLGATRGFLYPVAIAVSAVTAFTTPAFIRAADRLADRVDHKLPARIQTLSSVYGAWLEALSAAAPIEGRRARVHAHLRILLLDAVALTGLIVSHSLFGGSVAAYISPWLIVDIGVANWVVTVLVFTLAAPVFVGLVRAGGRLGEVIAEPLRADDALVGRAPARHRVLVTMLQLAVLLLVGLPIVALTQPFLPPFRGAVVLGAVQFALAVLVWRRAADMQGELRSGAESVLAAVRRHAAIDELAPAVAHLPPPVPLPPLPNALGVALALRLDLGDAAVGRTLIDLNLRSQTGATVLGITGADGRTAVPTGREPLREGHVLAIAGTRDAIEAACRVLQRGEMVVVGPVG
ncbi:MAG: cation:proton antiporter [Pseudomonadota bacterium]|nr:cation:proton antiporter [Pseudomonadota bacterium]